MLYRGHCFVIKANATIRPNYSSKVKSFSFVLAVLAGRAKVRGSGIWPGVVLGGHLWDSRCSRNPKESDSGWRKFTACGCGPIWRYVFLATFFLLTGFSRTNRLIFRTAWRRRCSFSTRAIRIQPSPFSPNALPGAMATSACSIRSIA